MSQERTKLVIGNWKMELSYKGQVELGRSLKILLHGTVADEVQVVVCPSYPVLFEMRTMFEKSGVVVGAQHVHWEERGPWTGAVSVTQLAPLVEWCIVGHSEQRYLAGITDEQVCLSAHLLLQHGMLPIVCVGETQEERAQDATVRKVTEQVTSLFRKATRTSLRKLVIAYEPVWAIGSGELPDPGETASVMLLVRKLAAERFGGEAAERLRVIYGGSVNPTNAASYVAEPGVDGVLVGGASVHPRQFADIIKIVQGAT